MNTRKMLAAVAAGSLTISAVLVGYGGTLAQEPSASPAPFVSPAPAPADMPGMDAGDISSMMGGMMGHMMDASDSHTWDHSPRGLDHASRGMMDHGDTSSAEECRQMMGEMKAMMESMMSGSMMGGQPEESGMGMGAASTAPTLDAPASPSTDPVDHVGHHPSPATSPAA